MREARVFKWAALGLGFAACALAAKAGAITAALTAISSGAIGFIAVTLAERDKHD
ncbi:MAG: hypothetical protein LBV30_06255 [Propionibacteriaceae bacterium]|jgi:hypothetical protein|nr:hypothetical protein [Propionibacteriaceae bacterium]